MRALLVDDSSTMRAILRLTLKSVGFETLEASNGEEALHVLKESGGADLALVDWNMPVMNGYEFLRAARKNHAYDQLVIVMVTTETEMDHIQNAIESGANEYIMKPFTRDVVIEKLQLLRMVPQSV